MEKYMLLAPIADGELLLQTTASYTGREGQKNCKNSTGARFWMGPHWVGPSALVEGWQKPFQNLTEVLIVKIT